MLCGKVKHFSVLIFAIENKKFERFTEFIFANEKKKKKFCGIYFCDSMLFCVTL